MQQHFFEFEIIARCRNLNDTWRATSSNAELREQYKEYQNGGENFGVPLNVDFDDCHFISFQIADIDQIEDGTYIVYLLYRFAYYQ